MSAKCIISRSACVAIVLIAFAGCARHAERSKEHAIERNSHPQPVPVAETQAEPGPEAINAPPLRVATYNINFANIKLNAVVEAIRQANADVVCLQETNARSADLLRTEFSDRYPEIRFFGSVHPYPAGGLAILSHRPIMREQFLPAKHGLFGTAMVEISHADQALQIICVHLQPIVLPRARGAGNVLGVLGAFEAAEEIHGAEMTDILNHVHAEGPTILAGDFNSCSTFQAPTLAKEHGLVDSFASLHENADEHPTWHWPTQIGQAKLRIDYIFHSADFRTVHSEVLKTEGSDHYLLVSDLAPIQKPSAGNGEP